MLLLLKVLVSRMSAPAQVLQMNLLNGVRLRNGQQVVIPFERVGIIGKAFATVIGFFKLIGLNHRTHGTVKYQNAFFYSIAYGHHLDWYVLQESWTDDRR